MPVSSEIHINSADRKQVSLLRTILEHRQYILSNAFQEFLYKYAGTGIGLMWNVIHPIMMVIVFSFVFTTIMPARYNAGGVHDISFVLFLCSGLLPWLSFVDGLQRETMTFIDSAGYLRKLAIPEEVFLAKTVVGSCILLAINIAVLVLAAFVLGFWPRWTWLLIPVVGAMMMLMAFGLGALFATVNVFTRDVSQIVMIVTQLWMWLTPIVYSSATMPEWLRSLQLANPIYPFIELFRDVFLFGSLGAPVLWLAALFWTCVTLLAGSMMLQRFRSELRDLL
jgi:ABC-type polysaccharide/polyol phosphate export permease